MPVDDAEMSAGELLKLLREIRDCLIDIETAINKLPILVMPGGVVFNADGTTVSTDVQARLIEAKGYFDMARRGYLK